MTPPCCWVSSQSCSLDCWVLVKSRWSRLSCKVPHSPNSHQDSGWSVCMKCLCGSVCVGSTILNSWKSLPFWNKDVYARTSVLTLRAQFFSSSAITNTCRALTVLISWPWNSLCVSVWYFGARCRAHGAQVGGSFKWGIAKQAVGI